MKTSLFLCLPLVLSVTACTGGGDNAGTSGGTNGGTDDDTGTRPSATCNEVVQGGALVSRRQVFENAPLPTGGTIHDGTYVLTGLREYVPTTMKNDGPRPVVKGTIVVRGSSLDAVAEENGAEVRETATLEADGTTLRLRSTCRYAGENAPEDPGPIVPYGYTATPTTLLLSTTVMRTAAVLEYTRQ